MKRINFRLIAFFVVSLLAFSNQVVFADIIIRQDPGNAGNGGTSPNIVSSMSTFSAASSSLSSSKMKSSKTVIPVTADIVGTDLIVDFTTTVGTAFVTVVDQNGNAVYQTTVDTFSDPELVIPVDGLSSGKYSLKIAYGSTNLIGNFQL
jgi:hypothetical protein